MRRLRLATLAIALAALALPLPARAQLFRRPVACDACIAGWYYFDEDPSGGTQDWNCSGSSYDGHRGSDFSLAGGNDAIANGYDVVAAAAGTVVSTQDGHFDHCTMCGGAMCGRDFGYGYGNHVVVDHGSYRVVYAHMRTGSIRVAPGDTVACGQTLGQIGSSGCTTGAHVHFETRPAGAGSSSAFDPFQGPCSPTTPSRWVSQGAHRAMPAPTCDGSPPPPTCPSGTYPIWTCIDGATRRRRCIDGVDMIEDCPAGCISMPVGTDDVCALPPDADGDGSRSDVDCNDGDASIHPGALDACGDGVDQDCSGADAVCPGTDAGPGDDAAIVRDASAPPADGAASRDAAAARIDAGAARGSGLTGGCGCRASTRASGARPWWLALVALLARSAIRRRPTRGTVCLAKRG
ncbi:MAG: peptidoglycan DD-metalloendopeptidase family protein [Sandaracinus sp.]